MHISEEYYLHWHTVISYYVYIYIYIYIYMYIYSYTVCITSREQVIHLLVHWVTSWLKTKALT